MPLLNPVEPRRTWRIVGAYTHDGERRYIFDNFAPTGPHKFVAPVAWFWGKR